MEHKSIKLNAILLIFLIIAMFIVKIYSTFQFNYFDLSDLTTDAAMNFIAGISTFGHIIIWTSIITPILFISIYYAIRRVVYQKHSLTAIYSTTIGLLASSLIFLNTFKLPALLIPMSTIYTSGNEFQKSIIDIIFKIQLDTFYSISVLGDVFFALWLLLTGVLIIKSTRTKSIIGVLTFIVAIFGFIAISLSMYPVLMSIYIYLMLFCLLLIAIDLLTL